MYLEEIGSSGRVGNQPLTSVAKAAVPGKASVLHRLAARALREPLTHFLAFGILIFLIAHAIEARSSRYRIDVSPADLTRIVNTFEQQYGSEPTPEQVRAMVDGYIREEIYLREGLALGLDRNDEIVRRRIGQKFDFLQQDMALPREPSEFQLKSWYANHRSDFTQPARRSFEHLYFAIDKRGEAPARSAAQLALTDLQSGRRVQSDTFPGPGNVVNLSNDDVSRLFGGSEFAASVAGANPGVWTGPLRSGFGWHLVRVTAASPSTERTFDKVRADVRLAWIEADRLARNRSSYEALLRQYDVRRADLPQ